MDILRFPSTVCFLLRCLVIPLPVGPNQSSVRMKEGRRCTDLDVFIPLPSPLELDDNIVTSGWHSLQPGLCSRTWTVTGLIASGGEERRKRAECHLFISEKSLSGPAQLSAEVRESAKDVFLVEAGSRNKRLSTEGVKSSLQNKTSAF